MPQLIKIPEEPEEGCSGWITIKPEDIKKNEKEDTCEDILNDTKVDTKEDDFACLDFANADEPLNNLGMLL